MEENKTNSKSSAKIILAVAIICILLCIPIGIVIGVHFVDRESNVSDLNGDGENNTINNEITNDDSQYISGISCGDNCMQYMAFDQGTINTINHDQKLVIDYQIDSSYEFANLSIKLEGIELINKKINFSSDLSVYDFAEFYALNYNDSMRQCPYNKAIIIYKNGKIETITEDNISDMKSRDIKYDTRNNIIDISLQDCMPMICDEQPRCIIGDKRTYKYKNNQFELIETSDVTMEYNLD